MIKESREALEEHLERCDKEFYKNRMANGALFSDQRASH